MNPAVALVRAPFTYRYNGLDVREEVILTQLRGYLYAQGVGPASVYDFHLDRSLRADDILRAGARDYVIAVRETGDNVHYAWRVATWLSEHGAERIWLYGQTARLPALAPLPARTQVIPHDEHRIAERLGLTSAPSLGFEGGLRPLPYFNDIELEDWQRSRLRGTLETTRGCPFPCRFCFINSGNNHERRWMMRAVDAIIDDIRSYVDHGVHGFVFHDSEFIGGSLPSVAARKALAERLIAEEFPIYYKIYARGDTLLKLGDLEPFRRSGLVSVFIGVESLVQSDLDTLKKATTVSALRNAIKHLAEAGIYMDLSFIMFHASTTVHTLRENLDAIASLYSGEHARYLGMPHFTFSFESGWSRRASSLLSKRTYVGWDVQMKSPAIEGACFDPALEPYMEICRLLSYEWSKKVIELNLARDTASSEERGSIEQWFSGLGAFCLEVMRYFLDRFESGRLTLDSLPEARAELFERLDTYYQYLPERLRSFETWRGHAATLDYRGSAPLAEEDEYWLDILPSGRLFPADAASLMTDPV